MKNIKTSHIFLGIVSLLMIITVVRYSNTTSSQKQAAQVMGSEQELLYTQSGIRDIIYDQNGETCSLETYSGGYIEKYQGKVVNNKDGTQACVEFQKGVRYKADLDFLTPLAITYDSVDETKCYISGKEKTLGTVAYLADKSKACLTIGSPSEGNVIQLNFTDVAEVVNAAEGSEKGEAINSFLKNAGVTLADSTWVSNIFIAPPRIAPLPDPTEGTEIVPVEPPVDTIRSGVYHSEFNFSTGTCSVEGWGTNDDWSPFYIKEDGRIFGDRCIAGGHWYGAGWGTLP